MLNHDSKKVNPNRIMFNRALLRRMYALAKAQFQF